MQPAKPGDKLLKFVTAQWYNDQNAADQIPINLKKLLLRSNPVQVPCIAKAGEEFERFSVAWFDNIGLPFADIGGGNAEQHNQPLVKISNNYTAKEWGIVQEICNDNDSSRLVVQGITWAKIQYVKDTLFASVGTTGATMFSSKIKTNIRVLYVPDNITGETTALIAINKDIPKLFKFTLLADINEDFLIEATITDVDGRTQDSYVIDDLEQFQHLKTGDVGWCIKEGNWYYVIHPEESNLVAAHVFVLTSTLARGEAYTATADVVISGETGIDAGASITVYNTGFMYGNIGAQGLAIKVMGQYWVVELNQFPMLLRAKLTGETHNITPGDVANGDIAGQVPTGPTIATITAVSQYPFSFSPITFPTIYNPSNFVGLVNDWIELTYSQTTERFEIINVFPQYQRYIEFKLTGDFPLGLGASTTATEAITPRGNDAGDLEAVGFSLRDIYNNAHNAKSTHTGIAIFNIVTEGYDIIDCKHAATECLGTLASPGFSGTPADFDVDVVAAGYLNGLDPTNGTGVLTVQNRYNWVDGTTGAAIHIQRDPTTGNWFPIQMEWVCP